MVNLGVQANAATGAEAMEQVNASSAALTEALVAAGIAEEDIQTSGLNLWTTTDDRGEVNGYQASLSVNVTVRDIEAVGPTIDAAQQAAGPGFTIGGVTFSFADPESVLEQARIDAVDSARTKAEQYAAAAGLTLGDVVSIVEGSATPPILYRAAPQMAAEDAAGPSISPGQLDLTVDISVTYSTTPDRCDPGAVQSPGWVEALTNSRPRTDVEVRCSGDRRCRGAHGVLRLGARGRPDVLQGGRRPTLR